MSGAVAVLDACALVPIRLATTLLWLAESGLYQPLWWEPILDEVYRTLPNVGVPPEHARRRIAMMREAFGAEALVDEFDDLIDEMGCHPKDRHVLAAAVRGGANLDDLALARDLTYDPRAWGDYQWAIDHLADRSFGIEGDRHRGAPARCAG